MPSFKYDPEKVSLEYFASRKTKTFVFGEYALYLRDTDKKIVLAHGEKSNVLAFWNATIPMDVVMEKNHGERLLATLSDELGAFVGARALPEIHQKAVFVVNSVLMSYGHRKCEWAFFDDEKRTSRTEPTWKPAYPDWKWMVGPEERLDVDYGVPKLYEGDMMDATVYARNTNLGKLRDLTEKVQKEEVDLPKLSLIKLLTRSKIKFIETDDGDIVLENNIQFTFDKERNLVDIDVFE